MNVYLTLLTAIFLSFGLQMAHAQSVHGVLRVVKGEVKIKSAKSGQTVRARIGEKVYPKDVVITGKDARAKIVMVDNNELNISPDSQLEIQHYEYNPEAGKKDVLLNVIYGKVRSKVEQKYDGKTSKFQIKTPSAVAGVRGTDFMTSFNPSTKASQIVTFEGRVEFGLPGPNGTIANPVTVTPGTTASVAASGAAPTPPTPMPKEELAKMDTETKSEPAADKRSPAGDENNKSDQSKEKKEESGDKDKKSGDKAGDNGKGDGKAEAKNDGKGDAKSDAKKADASGGSGNSEKRADDKSQAQNGGKSTESSAPKGGVSDASAAKGGASEGRGPASLPPAPTSSLPPPAAAAASPGGLMPLPLPTDANAPPPPPVLMPIGTGTYVPPPTFVNPVPVCDYCNQVIENAKTNLIIRVN